MTNDRADAGRQGTVLALFSAYLEDVGRIGARHETTRAFYISVISALFVFLSMAGKDGAFVNVRGAVLIMVGLVGIIICIAWFEHMRSFGALYHAKLDALRSIEKELPVQLFAIETTQLQKAGYTPLTVVDKVTPSACVLLFVGLLYVKMST